MRRVLVCLLATCIAPLGFAGSAKAAEGRIAVYEIRDASTSTGIVWGQVRDTSSECAADRAFKLTWKMRNEDRPEVVDRGRTSRDGALSALYLTREAREAQNANLIAPAAGSCPTLKVSLEGAALGVVNSKAKGAASRSRFVESQVSLIGVNGIDADGAIGGAIFNSPAGDCFADRKIKLIADGKLLDKGTTSQNGAWALHLKGREYEKAVRFRVELAKEKRGTDRCSSASTMVKQDSL